MFAGTPLVGAMLGKDPCLAVFVSAIMGELLMNASMIPCLADPINTPCPSSTPGFPVSRP